MTLHFMILRFKMKGVSEKVKNMKRGRRTQAQKSISIGAPSGKGPHLESSPRHALQLLIFFEINKSKPKYKSVSKQAFQIIFTFLNPIKNSASYDKLTDSKLKH